MGKHWKIRDVPTAELASLGKETGIPDLLLRLMWNRGLHEKTAIERYFDPRSRYLHSPFLLEGMPVAINRIFQAFATEESIRVFGDRDVDGITSTVLLLETLREYSKKVDYTVPVIEDGYGLNPDYLETAKRDGVTLIITVDCGISNFKEVEFAKTLGIDIIVTDHHEPPHLLPAAVSIINPKLPNSAFPYKDLAGVGVSLKLAMAMVIAASQHLNKPLVAFDYDGSEIDVIRFSPREGFSTLKHFHAGAFAGMSTIFWNAAEKATITEILPIVEKAGGQVIFLSTLVSAVAPDAVKMNKTDFFANWNIPPVISGARRLIIAFLKYLEATDPAIKALWQRSLDILTIGTIADMVPLKGENRTIAQLGMKFITKTKRLGLLSLFPLLGWQKKHISERDISFGIAPILNSSGRLKSAELAIDLLTTEFPPKSKELAQDLYNLNIERKKLAEESYRHIRELLLAQNDPLLHRILLVHAPRPNQGVTGIVATRLMLDFCRPTFVLLEDHGKLLGSGRSYRSISIMNALHFCAASLEKYGGHAGAAGLTLQKDKLDEFRARLREYAANHITEEDLTTEWMIDAEIDIDMVGDSLLGDVLKFAPFGIENPPPMFMARNVPTIEVRKVGGTHNHLRFKFRKTSGQWVFGIGFGLGKLMDREVISNSTCNVVFTIELNEYNGMHTPQLVVHDVQFPDLNNEGSGQPAAAPGTP